MALVYKDRVKESISAPIGSADFDFSAASTPTGYQSFVNALADADVVIYGAEDESGNWEVGVGTWTETGTTLARTTILASSNSGSAESFSGTVTVYITNDAQSMTNLDLASGTIDPGGRLTLESGVPFSTSNQSAKTTIYYTPDANGSCPLWDGDKWVLVEFSELSFTVASMGTITADVPWDIFGYISSGTLALEKVKWTNATTRATALATLNGRLCKSGDATRLYLGTVCPGSTTTIEDTLTYRGIYNKYNQRAQTIYYDAGSSNHTYTTDGPTVREYNNTTNTNVFEVVIGEYQAGIVATIRANVSAGAGSGYCTVAVGVDTSSSNTAGWPFAGVPANGAAQPYSASIVTMDVGYHMVYLLDRNTSTADLTADYGAFGIRYKA